MKQEPSIWAYEGNIYVREWVRDEMGVITSVRVQIGDDEKNVAVVMPGDTITCMLTANKTKQRRYAVVVGRAQLREALADLAHRQWSGWIDWMFSKIATVDHYYVIPGSWFDRWMRQKRTEYTDLTYSEQESDRQEADRVLDLLESFGITIE